MKFLDYIGDSRWERISAENKAKFLAPNPFVHILYFYKDRITELKDIDFAIETGTYMGWTAEFFAELFDKAFSVEKFAASNPYDSQNYLKIHQELQEKHPNLDIVYSDTTLCLGGILSQFPEERFVILLDAHAPNQESPLLEELQAIKESSWRNDHIIIIDDGDDFGKPFNPCLEEIKKKVYEINPAYTFENTKVGRSTHIAYV